MEPLLKSDIFFFITSVSVVLLTVIFIIIGVYLIKIMKNFSHMSETLKKTVDDTDDELRDIGVHVRESPIFTFIFGRKRVGRHHAKKS
jgi:hypothetical protein